MFDIKIPETVSILAKYSINLHENHNVHSEDQLPMKIMMFSLKTKLPDIEQLQNMKKLRPYRI